MSSRGSLAWLLTGLALLFLTGAAAAGENRPLTGGYVVDDAELLTTAARARITTKLRAYEEKTTNQITVLTVPVLGEVSAPDSGSAALKLWDQGEPGKDNSVVLLIVKNGKKLRFKVGTELADLLPDEVREKIMRRILWPNFQAHNYDRGVEEVVAAIIGQLGGKDMVSALPDSAEPIEPGSSSAAMADFKSSSSERIFSGVIIFIILGAFTIVTLIIPERSMALAFYLFMIPFWATFPTVFVVEWQVGLILFGAYLVLVPLLRLLLIAVKLVKSEDSFR